MLVRLLFVAALLFGGGAEAWAAPEAEVAQESASEPDTYYDDYPSVAEVPEPLVFDLARPLGAKKGELEVNTLFVMDRSASLGDLQFAPEIEYALFDDFGLELELPFDHGYRLEALKFAIQGTFGHFGWRGQFVHGTQWFAEKSVRSEDFQLIGVYLFGHRIDRAWSYLAMAGFAWTPFRAAWFAPIVNFAVFKNYTREVDFALELNWRGLGSSFETLLVMPQVHVLLRHDWKFQVGLGASLAPQGGLRFASSLRVIKEFN